MGQQCLLTSTIVPDSALLVHVGPAPGLPAVSDSAVLTC